MKPGQVRRFSGFQVALHWGQAVPYIILLISGGMMLAQRLFHAEAVPHAALAGVHSWTAVALIGFLILMLIALLWTGHFKSVRQDLIDCLLIRPSDLLWLIKVPLHAIRPHTKLPPAGRFNAGQKLHGAFIILAVSMFTVTGVSMMLWPGALAAWAAHAILFVLASGFLSLHLFLSLVNPATRKALGGIFTGYVPKEYADTHHPLWTGAEQAHTHGPILSWKASLAAGAGIAVALAAMTWSYGPRRLSERISQWVGHHGADAIMPGDLCAAHADDPDAASCSACHRAFGPVPSAACLACHPQIQRVLAGRIGFHGTVRGECRDCHADHAGYLADIRGLDSDAFDHKQARFALEGKHQEVLCDGCHLRTSTGLAGPRKQYVGMRFDTCRACHADPHTLGPARDCARCHTERGWKHPEVVFDHDRDCNFALKGKHASAACGSCHSSAGRALAAAAGLRAIRPIPAAATAPPVCPLTGVGRRCEDCHVDPHRPSLGNDCKRCHNEKAWTGQQVSFKHDRDTRFELRESHAAVECKSCHKPPRPKAALAEARFADAPAECSNCHADPHRGTLGKACTSCHNEKKWTGKDLLFAHGRGTKFALGGRHVGVACAKCHPLPSPSARLGEARFAKTPTDCADCHTGPHGGQFKAGCAACHGERGWKGKPLRFAHNRHSRFKIDATHAGLSCEACHKQQGGRTRYRPLPGTCAPCHQDQAKALAGKTPWLDAKPDPHAGRVDCVRCHVPGVKSPTPDEFAQTCRGCHGPQYRRLYFDWSKALSARAARARELLARLRREKSPRADEVARKIEAARAAGLHNTQLAKKLLDQVLTSGSGR